MTESTTALARFVNELTFDALPAAVVAQTKASVVDWLGVALSGSKEPAITILCDVARELGNSPQATVIGRELRTDPAWGALINGTAGHALDYDDLHYEARAHVTTSILPATLALAEWKHLSGRQLLTAFVAGFEVEARLGMAYWMPMRSSGRHITGHVGNLGAVAAVANLLGLPVQQVDRALGIAAVFSGGMYRAFGTMTKPLQAGKGAMVGVMAGLFAAEGFTGPESVFDGHQGFGEMFAPGADPTPVTAGLGTRWEILNNSFKPFASCGSTHAALTAVVELSTRHALVADDVDRIELDIWPGSRQAIDRREPRTGLDGKFSIYYCAAVALAEKAANEDQFSDEKVQDPRLIDLARGVRLIDDAAFGMSQARARVFMKDGRVLVHEVEAGKGSPGNPLRSDEIVAKFLGNARRRIPDGQAQAILEQTQHLETITDVGGLTALLGAAER